jgi:tetratricopeptide (TPR) repeat protein
MAKVREKDLHGYCAEANQLIEQGALEAAVAIGQHILRHYPKHVEAYRVLAKATLEQGEVGYAADLFKRVLSADPEDLEARVGLGIIYTGEEALEEALWQWDRAFELAPSNSDIRAQLRQVRERLEGPEFPRIELTRGALGRLYAQGGLFQQAADEFRAVLNRDPEQVDMQVTLAETLWRDGKLAEAEAVCEQILEALPNCGRESRAFPRRSSARSRKPRRR